MNYLDDIKANVADCQKVLIGIGTNLEWDMIDADRHKELVSFYNQLKELVEGRDYYIITLCKDDVIFEVFEEDAKITAPAGSMKRFQCANACSDMDNEAFAKYQGRVIFDKKMDKCPVCGGELVANNITAANYAEEGYFASFADYKKWLQSTVNRKLTMLELGAGLNYPSVIRFAFDKLCYYNQKAIFYRINDKLYQHTAENKDRGVSVAMEPIALFK